MRAGGLHILHRVEVHARHLPEFIPSHPDNQNSRLCQEQCNRVRYILRLSDEDARSPECVIQLLDTPQVVSGEAKGGKLCLSGSCWL